MKNAFNEQRQSISKRNGKFPIKLVKTRKNPLRSGNHRLERGFYGDYFEKRERGTRYLDAKTSRWMSADPALTDYIPGAPINDEVKKQNQNLPGMGGVFNVVNLHLYHYAGNNPVKYLDPNGKQMADYNIPENEIMIQSPIVALQEKIDGLLNDRSSLMGQIGTNEARIDELYGEIEGKSGDFWSEAASNFLSLFKIAGDASTGSFDPQSVAETISDVTNPSTPVTDVVATENNNMKEIIGLKQENKALQKEIGNIDKQIERLEFHLDQAKKFDEMLKANSPDGGN